MRKFIQAGLGKLGYRLVKVNRPLRDDTELYRSQYGDDSVERKAFYNISAGGHFGFGGNFQHPCWTNIDIERDERNRYELRKSHDIVHDLLDMGNFPLESDSAELFHSRFCIEHITDEAAAVLFREAFRCLKRGGAFKLVVPNFQLDYEAFLRRDRHYFFWIENYSRPEMMELMRYAIPLNKATLHQIFLVHFASNASTIHMDGSQNPISDRELEEIIASHSFQEAMDICTSRCSLKKQRIYRQNHINWWSYEKLHCFLHQAGFSKVFSLSPGQSNSSVMRNKCYFDSLWPDCALIVEGIK